MGLVGMYLKAFNTLACLSWGALLVHLIYLASPYPCDTPNFYNHVKICHIILLFDVLHTALGFSKGNLLTSLGQQGIRNWVVFGIMALPGRSQAEGVACLMWSIAEAIRYAHYLFDSKLTTWLRYTGFIVLYPVGYSAEMLMTYYRWDIITACCPKVYSIEMPNALNISFDHSWAVAGIMVPVASLGMPYIYMTLLKQRPLKLKAKAKQD